MLTNPNITLRQKQIIHGTILGGSSIVLPKGGRNCYLSMRCKEPKWIEYKSQELKALTSQAPFTLEKTNRWHSLCYTLFKEYRTLYYKRSKRYLTLDMLDPLQDVAIAIWFGDCGRALHNKIILNTHVWGLRGSKIINEYFQLLGYDSCLKKEKDCHRVEINETSRSAFLRLVVPQLPAFKVLSMGITGR